LSTQALKDHAQGLEHMVARRTAELTSRSEQLEAEVETRRVAEEKLQRAVSELHQMAMSDGLTQLANRTRLKKHLSTHWRALTRNGGQMSLLMIDVDLFKAYNDHYGHLKGDDALRIVADHLAEAARYPQDLACRYGGEEFVLVLPDTDLESAQLIAERLRESLTRAAIPHATSTIAAVVTVSIGIAVARPQDAVDPWTLLEQADQALYRAKTQGRNQVCAVTLGPGHTRELTVPQPRRPESSTNLPLW
jgi:diguanylate cyclase (GGDEF)-like protein